MPGASTLKRANSRTWSGQALSKSVKVVRTALQDAASVARVFMTTGSIAEEKAMIAEEAMVVENLAISASPLLFPQIGFGNDLAPSGFSVGDAESTDHPPALNLSDIEGTAEGGQTEEGVDGEGGGSNCIDRSSPVLGRAQGWRFALPPPAASALTLSAHRAFGHSSGRRDAPPGGRTRARSSAAPPGRAGVPGLVARQHRVQDHDQLAHAGDDGDFRLFAFWRAGVDNRP